MTASINKGPLLGQRHLQTLLLFLVIVVNYLARLNASVAVVAMTNSNDANAKFKTYKWNEMERSYILSSFFWGYLLTQFLGGWLGRQIGCKKTMFISTLGSAVLAILPPFCVSWGGWQVYCAIRVGMGLFQGCLFPCIHAHLANWSPVKERNRLGALANSGLDCGNVVAMFVSGTVAASSAGWPAISYISCGVGIVWCVLWLLFGANTPRDSKFITELELSYIEQSRNEERQLKGSQTSAKIPVPWRAILTSLPFWAFLIVRCSQSWGISTLQAEIPAYMNGVLLLNMKSNAVYSSLPFFASWFMSYVYLIVSDVLLMRQVLSLQAIRKTINSISFFLPALGLIAVGFVNSEQKTLAIVLMTVSVGLNAGSTIGSAINSIDLSPNHAGILMGIVNTAMNSLPILTPLFVGLIVKDEHSRVQWQIVFIVAAIVYFIGNIIYLIWGRMDLQPWDAEDFLSKTQVPSEVFRKKSIEDSN